MSFNCNMYDSSFWDYILDILFSVLINLEKMRFLNEGVSLVLPHTTDTHVTSHIFRRVSTNIMCSILTLTLTANNDIPE